MRSGDDVTSMSALHGRAQRQSHSSFPSSSSRTPMTGNHAGPSRTRAMEPLYRPPGQRGILGEGLIRGGRAMTFRINIRHTLFVGGVRRQGHSQKRQQAPRAALMKCMHLAKTFKRHKGTHPGSRKVLQMEKSFFFSLFFAPGCSGSEILICACWV